MNTVPDYSLEEFEKDLEALLRKAELAGLDTDSLCELAERVLERGWAES